MWWGLLSIIVALIALVLFVAAWRGYQMAAMIMCQADRSAVETLKHLEDAKEHLEDAKERLRRAEEINRDSDKLREDADGLLALALAKKTLAKENGW